MRINEGNKGTPPAGVGKTTGNAPGASGPARAEPAPAASSPRDAVTVSLGPAAAAVSGTPVPDSARVAEILARISSGKYSIDFERLADKMLDEELPRGRR